MRIDVEEWNKLQNNSVYYKDWDKRAKRVMDAIGSPTEEKGIEYWVFSGTDPCAKRPRKRLIAIALTKQGKLEILEPYEKTAPYWYLKRAVEIVQEMQDAFEAEGLIKQERK